MRFSRRDRILMMLTDAMCGLDYDTINAFLRVARRINRRRRERDGRDH